MDTGRVCVFGSGGPVGAAAQAALQGDYTLRLTDIRDVQDIVDEGEPQSTGAPLPAIPVPPHEWIKVDVGNYEQVLAAAQGMDALINVSVLRHSLAPAFHVNTIGAYNVMKAAVACGIKKVIHTGPRHTRLGFEGDYWSDHRIPDEAPLHPGADLYALTKCLGGEIVQTFAEAHDMDVITFLYCAFRHGDGGRAADGSGVHPLAIAWEDTGDPFRYALRAGRMPSNYEVFDMMAQLPHGKFGSSKAERLLGWKPKHNFERLYSKG
jgi:nucleoside-diphosphate-sugar epimerase